MSPHAISSPSVDSFRVFDVTVPPLSCGIVTLFVLIFMLVLILFVRVAKSCVHPFRFASKIAGITVSDKRSHPISLEVRFKS